MNDSNNFVARAIIGGAYLIAATILFVGIGVMFATNPEPMKSGYLFMGGIFFLMVFFYIGGLKTLTAVSRELKK